MTDITLVAVLCHVLNGDIPVCVEEIVPTQFPTQVGKISDPVEMSFTFQQCITTGQQIVADWAGKHPIYRLWKVHSWKCVPGEYNSGHEA